MIGKMCIKLGMISRSSENLVRKLGHVKVALSHTECVPSKLKLDETLLNFAFVLEQGAALSAKDDLSMMSGVVAGPSNRYAWYAVPRSGIINLARFS